jgi:integrase
MKLLLSFGNGLFKRAWLTAILRSHGVTPSYTTGANLDATSRDALRTIGLHFHDLRREAGSRWMDAGVPIAAIQKWLGHANVSQTSTYLAGTTASEQDAMRAFEATGKSLAKVAQKRATQGQVTLKPGHKRLNKTAVGPDLPIM